MIISTEAFERLRCVVENRILSNVPITIEDAMEHNVPFDSLSSLLSQMSLRLNTHQFSISEVLRSDVYNRIESGEESLWNICHNRFRGSYTVAKAFLELKFGKDFKVASFLENPLLIVQAPLRHDLLRMILDDNSNSVEANIIKETTGKDYEDILIEMLNIRKMCFETEEESRAKGKPKTPDVLFMVPMATSKSKYDPTDFSSSTWGLSMTGSNLQHSSSHSNQKKSPSKRSQSIQYQSEDYLVINWIDSKAMFADKRTFQDHLVQLESYRNRYGRGMVIYWHGVVEDVYSLLLDDMIVVRDSFPDEWIFPTGETADGRVVNFEA